MRRSNLSNSQRGRYERCKDEIRFLQKKLDDKHRIGGYILKRPSLYSILNQIDTAKKIHLLLS